MGSCLTSGQIEAYVAATLSPDQAAEFARHFAECATCRAAVESRRAEQALAGEIHQAFGTNTATSPDQLPTASEMTTGEIAERIEGYDILRELHRGGQGVVYKAIQRATKRTVALKVLLQGPYATAKQRHRFEREIDLVASLQHPNIVTLYDSGLSAGRHYFAMEYIHGQPLDAYLSAKTVPIDDTLRLFAKICTAVNYAHQRAVIHRDLKPGNILIDSSGEPHILDFGLAKTAGPGLAEGGPVTVTGEFMGTLAYASPEQTQGDPNQIDIRTDVYSLGVILYEMLTGKYPYEVVGQMADVLRNIAEAEPKKPSTIRRQINDEVETIVLKALAKDKVRRYQSAENLAKDVEHYLAGEPIEAKRDSGWYVLRKTILRHRVPVGVGVAFMLVILTSLIVSARALYRAEAEALRANKEATNSKAMTEFLEGLLAAADPAKMGRGARVVDVLAQSEQQLINTLGANPEVGASICVLISQTYSSLGLYKESAKLTERIAGLAADALGEDHVVVSELRTNLAASYLALGRVVDAEKLLTASLGVLRRHEGDRFVNSAVTLLNLAHARLYNRDTEHAKQLAEEALKILGVHEAGNTRWPAPRKLIHLV
jgi:non-specific serine/threonine protein kinase/serine/threonine-protein kinase